LRGAPDEPTADSELLFGTYACACADTDLRLRERGVGRFRRAVSEKRWQWFSAFDENLAVGGAVVDAGFFGNVFVWVFDRAAGEMVVDADVLVPSSLVSVSSEPERGTIARISLPGRKLRVVRDAGTEGDYEGDDSRSRLGIEGRFKGIDLDLTFETDGNTPVTAVCPVEGREGGVNVTQKETCATVKGEVSAGGEDHAVDGVGNLDYSHGLLARETRWSWAIGSGTTEDGGARVGFNLVSGFNDGLENAVWVDGEPEAVGAASFETGEGGWRIRTDCGTVDVRLAVEGVREENKNVGVVVSRYSQPVGRWTGTVAGYDFEGAGVAEEHLARW